jgi:hypothetical protein
VGKIKGKRLGYINRDKNATYNIKKIVKYLIKNGMRPLNYMRDQKIETIEKLYIGKRYKEYIEDYLT